ncbi:MAG: methylenetetrahydrofolate reductase [NAD(P)H] [Chloroherpetonaceae bacterium]|nr:methylenetetrahydrofolate reductase [NAD(P)H] [Chthonomonadaceae bacterium]MDW8208511.1 methylenetetrahydrofolate reductase [NAD(P)H] [Chloroherpetonaceae bacterium]
MALRRVNAGCAGGDPLFQTGVRNRQSGRMHDTEDRHETMHIQDIFAQHRTTFSFEFFPPRDEAAAEQLYRTIAELEPLRPSFVSVTYGAGGTTRRHTHDLVVRLKRTTSCDPIPHLTCVCHTVEEIRDILERYAENNISNILALGGDPPRHLPHYDRSQDPFQHAADLVRYIRKFNEQGIHPDKRGFGIGVAGFPEGHPATPNRMREMDYLKAKVDEGADYIVTQLFFDNHDFYDFRERCELAGIKVPIIAGIMPVTSLRGLYRMAELALCSRFPARLLRALQRCGDNEEAVRRVGVHWATEQCRDLLDNHVRGIHFYTLNRSTATREIYANLGVTDSIALAS